METGTKVFDIANDRINKFSKAVVRLNEGIQNAKTPLEIDGVIQRFEFCFELLWNQLRWLSCEFTLCIAR